MLILFGKNPRFEFTKSLFLSQGKHLPDGSDRMSGNEIFFESVNRRHSGTYQCKADNGYGQGVTDKITLEVEYSPEVEVQEVSGSNLDIVHHMQCFKGEKQRQKNE